MSNIKKSLVFGGTKVIVLCFLASFSLLSQAKVLKSLEVEKLPSNQTRLRLSFDSEAPEIKSYSTEEPARVAIDLKGVTQSKLKQTRYELEGRNLKTAVVLITPSRTRLIVNMNSLVAFDTKKEGNQLDIFLKNVLPKLDAEQADGSEEVAEVENVDRPSIESIDFNRTSRGQGQLVIMFSDARPQASLAKRENKITATIRNVDLPKSLKRRFDVADYDTQVDNILIEKRKNDVRLYIEANSSSVEYNSFQANKKLTINIKSKLRKVKQRVENVVVDNKYKGEKLSLNFQNIEVRAVLQIIAEFTGLNLVASDSVQGSITLRLKDVPWDQALDLVLKTKGLDKRQMGKVLLVAPAAEIASREKAELETLKQSQDLAPLKTEYISLNYAKAGDLVKLLDTKQSILSERGTAVVDSRTNTLLLKDTQENLNRVKQLIKVLDVPVKQVLIEARIVVANTNVGEEMGIKWGGAGRAGSKNNVFLGGSQQTISEASQIGFGGATLSQYNLSNANVVDFGVKNSQATTFAIGYQGADFLLDMELAAIETEGNAEIVSQPRVITADGQKASIESGKEIPYQQASSSGATNVAFKSAVLKLEVTPQITPDNRIVMNLVINQDSIGENTSAGPSINTNMVKTQVLVDNGETVVLGGIFRSEEVVSVSKTPLLGDIPFLGRLFRYKQVGDSKSELLVFITPKLLKESLATQ